MSTTNRSPRVYVLGMGSIGTFVAHSLAEIPDRPSITLLLHRASLLNGYIENGKRILLETREGEFVAQDNYNFEFLHDDKKWYSITPHIPPPVAASWSDGTSVTNTIDNLIVCVKAPQTVEAIRPLLSRITPSSTILFLQNGAGMIEDVNQHLFRNPETRPNYIIGVISHGVSLNAPFNITHTGFAATSLGPSAQSGASSEAHRGILSSYLLRALPLVPRFNARSYHFPSILQIQLEKLTVNAFCNPLCALADSPNKYLFTIPETRRALIAEISSIILSLPELEGVLGVKERFSVDALEKTVMSIIERTAETTCSMVWDLRMGKKTEIRYINGYWARKGREVGVRTPLNDNLIEKIEAKTK